jgi:hypothetical protein
MNTITSSGRTTAQASVWSKKELGVWVEWALLGLIIVLILLCAVGATYYAIASQLHPRNYLSPCQMVDMYSYRLSPYCVGKGTTLSELCFSTKFLHVWPEHRQELGGLYN